MVDESGGVDGDFGLDLGIGLIHIARLARLAHRNKHRLSNATTLL